MPSGATREWTAVLVVRAWPHGSPPRLAARITYTQDVASHDPVSLAATGTREIVAAVARWLEELERLPAAGDGVVTEA